MNDLKVYELTNTAGVCARFTNYGQRLLSLEVPDRRGKMADVVLAYQNASDHIQKEPNYYGAFVGRFCNRIAHGQFILDGQRYSLHQNHGPHHIHGGIKGFSSIFWSAKQEGDGRLLFWGTSPHLDEGYPGNLDVAVTYELTEDNELHMTYRATSDRPTPVNLTHHSFFNLKGAGNGTIEDHVLTINADGFTPVDEQLIPTGEIQEVTGTPFDFRIPKRIGEHINDADGQLKLGRGYDHNYVLKGSIPNKEGLPFAARVFEPESGRVMEVFTDTPGIQFYSGNFLDGSDIGKMNRPYKWRSAFCLEPQFFPDSVNQAHFPSCILKPGEEYCSKTVFRFAVDV